MNLQYALLFIGIVIVAIVALTTYDMARLRRPRSRSDEPAGEFPEDETSARPSVLSATREHGSEKVLRSDVEVAAREVPRHELLRKEIRRLEEVATMPLDLAPCRDGRSPAENTCPMKKSISSFSFRASSRWHATRRSASSSSMSTS